MTAEPIRGLCGRLAALQDRADELWRQEDKGQHLAQIFDGDAIAGGNGHEVVAVAEGNGLANPVRFTANCRCISVCNSLNLDAVTIEVSYDWHVFHRCASCESKYQASK